ncbi:bifunctional diaminohydroxyphosphoribosylaminopyrimidine deaminase/5-amino-6-(5-phosphoribosylamino)uracil reductase RibD [bacterium]|nr:bifunctional diaminohydroxyphosphoribosylaminopyrimidine deaminase/5-amino-6-(5-phosphoribosylamino)uracil reductase RibD [bacterium]
MRTYSREMKKCIKLAKLAQGKTSPNPLVGCLILDRENNVISTGYHAKYGQYHAERDALSKLDSAQGCTLIVNLEPCCHQGKTPPCTDIILKKGIKRVVYGMQDPNPLVSGKGLKILKEAGIEIIGPVLEDECRKLNEIFIKNQTEHKTFVAIKTATTIDGKIATYNGDSKWITSQKAREHARRLRKIYDAILTSSSTIISDNPTMEHEKKVILDRELKTDLNSNIYKQGEIYIFHSATFPAPERKDTNITYIPTPVKNNRLNIEFILKKLYEVGIMSVFVESGGKLNSSFLPYADKLYHFIAPKILADNSGKSCFDGLRKDKISDCTNFNLDSSEVLSENILLTYKK